MATKKYRVVPDLSSSTSVKMSDFAREISVDEAIKWLRAESLDGKKLNRIVTAVRDPVGRRNFISITLNEAA